MMERSWKAAVWAPWAALALLAGSSVGAAQQGAPPRPPVSPPRAVPARPAPAPGNAAPAQPQPAAPAAPAQPAPPENPLLRPLSLEARAAPVGDLVAQLSAAINVPMSADAALGQQRVSLLAASSTVSGLQGALASLFRTGWRATGEGEDVSYRLVNDPQLYAQAARLRAERRALLLTRLLEVERIMRAQDGSALAARLRGQVAERRPDLPPASVDQITPDFLRQTLLLGPLRLGIAQNLLRTGSVAVSFRSLPVAYQELMAQFFAEQFQAHLAGLQVASAEISGPLLPESVLVPAMLSSPQARLEYRFLYGDRWSDELLMVRVGLPDNFATAYLPGALFDLPDYASLYPEGQVKPVAAELGRTVRVSVDSDAETWDQALLRVARETGINVLSDSFPRPGIFHPVGLEATITGPTLGDLLDKMAERYGYTWWKVGDWYVFRNRLWAEELRVQVPESLLQSIGAGVDRTGGLTPENLLSLAALTDEQLLTLHLYGSAAGSAYARPDDLNMNEIRLARSGLTLYGQMTEAQRTLVRTTGIPVTLMTPAQQALFTSIAAERSAAINPADREDWRFRISDQFERRRLGTGWAEVGTLQITFDFGQNGSRTAILAVRAPAVEAPKTRETAE
ncbi:MAG TPA: hypothetical protein VFU47_09450 [Armatimonadota bacterium]|nr:hypothetical protein [Armatimonadota bacterium]